MSVPSAVLPSRIYRHFKGGYYIVHSLAVQEDSGIPVVVYQSLKDGGVWTRPLDEFCSKVPDEKDSPTGQSLRFELVTDFNNQLSMVSTSSLIQELYSRDDNPLSIYPIEEVQSSVWREEYILGRFVTVPTCNSSNYEDFEVLNVFATLEGARRFKADHGLLSQMTILRRVFVRVD